MPQGNRATWADAQSSASPDEALWVLSVLAVRTCHSCHEPMGGRIFGEHCPDALASAREVASILESVDRMSLIHGDPLGWPLLGLPGPYECHNIQNSSDIALTPTFTSAVYRRPASARRIRRAAPSFPP